MFTVQPTSCLRCGQRPVARLNARELLCFHCRLVQPALNGLEYPFTLYELTRLAVYRAAVKAGFYSDYPTRARC
jgi:hypothetical protein